MDQDKKIEARRCILNLLEQEATNRRFRLNHVRATTGAPEGLEAKLLDELNLAEQALQYFQEVLSLEI